MRTCEVLHALAPTTDHLSSQVGASTGTLLTHTHTHRKHRAMFSLCSLTPQAPHAQELVEGPWQQQHVDAGAGILIPVPAPLGGVVVVGENVLSYCGGPGAGPGGGAPVSAPLRQTIITVSQGP